MKDQDWTLEELEEKLTLKQIMFIDKFLECGSQMRAYRETFPDANDHTTNYSTYRLMRKPHVKAYLKLRLDELKNERMASIHEVQEFWASTMRNRSLEMRDRLKASELIARSHGVFLDKIEHSGDVSVHVSIEWE